MVLKSAFFVRSTITKLILFEVSFVFEWTLKVGLKDDENLELLSNNLINSVMMQITYSVMTVRMEVGSLETCINFWNIWQGIRMWHTFLE